MSVVQHQQIRQLAELVNNCVDQVNTLMHIVGVMKDRLEKYKEDDPAGKMIQAIEGTED